MTETVETAAGSPRADPAETLVFKGIEGTRAWLAWTIVAGHMVLLSPLASLKYGLPLIKLSEHAVMIFIIISGFVITHLITTKAEPYSVYIGRRALRIYPAYLVALTLGYLTTPLLPDLIAALPSQPPPPLQRGLLREMALAAPPALQIGLHLLLAQGLVPNNVLRGASFGYLGVGWSLSLEWQFYLVAPLFVLALRRWPVAMLVIVFCFATAYALGLFGVYPRPSMLAGAAWYFALGAASRLNFKRLPRWDQYPWVVIVGLAPTVLLTEKAVPLIAWAALLAYLRSDIQWPILDSTFVRFWGERSYAVYVVHFPILLGCAWTGSRLLGLGTKGATLLTCVAGAAVVAMAADLVYRLVERPGISFGRRFGREPEPAAQGW